MPAYIYHCPEGHGEVEIIHPAGASASSFCPVCSKKLRRRFTMPAVNWGGLPPSKRAHLPRVMAAVKEAERRRYDRGEPA